MTPALDVLSGLDVEPGDLSLVKTGSSGFLTSSLHQHLQHMGTEHVIYTGVLERWRAEPVAPITEPACPAGREG